MTPKANIPPGHKTKRARFITINWSHAPVHGEKQKRPKQRRKCERPASKVCIELRRRRVSFPPMSHVNLRTCKLMEADVGSSKTRLLKETAAVQRSCEA